MINKSNTQIEIEFGKGDICISGGYFKNEKNENVGLVTFTEQEQREIGTVGIIKPNQEYEVGDFPIILTFKKVESIDVLIEQLEQAKYEMLGIPKEHL